MGERDGIRGDAPGRGKSTKAWRGKNWAFYINREGGTRSDIGGSTSHI